ncbi:MAG: rod shape-determining protein RodA [Bacteroidales bacterium]|nr:rod shape-determining protein RodA [Bacteroidales bacterium]
MRSRNNLIQNLDWPTVTIYLVMIIFGWLNIYAAVYNEEHQSILDISQSYGKQMIWIATSILLAMIILIIDAKFYSVFSYAIYGFILLVLVAVLVFGKEVAGSKSWLQIGSIGLQPAEFMKFATGLALAKYLSTLSLDLKEFRQLLKAFVIIAIPLLMIELQNDTGTALVFVAFFLVFYRQGMPGTFLFIGVGVLVLFFLTLLIQNLILIGLLAVLMIVALFLINRTPKNIVMIILMFLASTAFVLSVDYGFHQLMKPHQQTRVKVLIGLETDLLGAGYNVHQSLIAIGSGGFWGKGFLKGTQTKYNFVPEQSTDFIFCTVGEEWGFIGSLAVVVLFAVLLIRLIRLAERQRSVFSKIYGYSVFSILFFHFVVNIAMTLGLFPVIGIPLPFFSYGGSSLWSFTILLFIFLKLDADRLNVL